MLRSLLSASSTLILCLGTVSAQLSGPVGPTTSTASKHNTICNVLNYGGSIGSSDIGPAIGSAFTNCVLKNSGSTLYLPAGNYEMATWQTLNGGSHWAFQMDGFITRANGATAGGNMIAIENANDFEFYSSNSAGGIQGNGYQCRNAGPRLIRMVTSTNWSLHDLILVDSPEFHVVVDSGSNGEVYNMMIRGANIGGSDGVDVWGTNHHIHDVSVTNRDECVTVKSPANNILVERIWCNQSGGCAIGSLGVGTSITEVLYQNVYTNGGNQALMIKSNGGNGTASNIVFQNFLSVGTAYGLDINQYWSSEAVQPGNGVQLSNIQFKNWDGNVVDGVQRSPIQILCADGAPCTGITLTDVYMWSQTNQATVKCESAFGSGECLRSGTPSAYAATTSTITQPAGYSNPPTMPGDLTDGFDDTEPIPIPTAIPTSFYPGLPAISPLAKSGGSPTTSSSQPTSSSKPATTSSSAPSATQTVYGQCGGIGWTGPTKCAAGDTCTYSSAYYSQCLP